MNLINYLTRRYEEQSYYIHRKAQYSVVLICISIAAMITILILEAFLVSYTPGKLISAIVFVLGFILLLSIIKVGRYELAVNLLITASMARSLMIYFYPTPFQFYVMGILSMITIAVIHTKNYQIIVVDIMYGILYLIKIPVMHDYVASGELHFRAYSQAVYASVIFFAVVLMLSYLTVIINREIGESETLMISANTDGLTGLYNRRKVSALYDSYMESKREIGLIIMDIDYFKDINDTYGHQVGDDILIALSDLFTDKLGLLDISRWGGEEFLLLCPDKGLDESYECAERIRQTIETTNFSNDIHITVSIGVTTNNRTDSIIDSIRRADNALYTSKANGRNQTTKHA